LTGMSGSPWTTRTPQIRPTLHREGLCSSRSCCVRVGTPRAVSSTFRRLSAPRAGADRGRTPHGNGGNGPLDPGLRRGERQPRTLSPPAGGREPRLAAGPEVGHLLRRCGPQRQQPGFQHWSRHRTSGLQWVSPSSSFAIMRAVPRLRPERQLRARQFPRCRRRAGVEKSSCRPFQ
jgi:hypothetical protein